MKTLYLTFNRTTLELKCVCATFAPSSLSSFNRTTLELKSSSGLYELQCTCTFNRTTLELKYTNIERYAS